jgi:hypothetical protein
VQEIEAARESGRRAASEAQTRYESILEDVRRRLGEAEAAHAKVSAAHTTTILELRETRGRAEAFEGDLKQAQAEIARLREQLAKGDEAVAALSRDLASVNTRNAVVEQQVADQRHNIQTMQALLDAEKAAKSKASEEADLYKKAQGKTSEKLERANDEITKANGIISTLQETYNTVKAKQKAKSEELRSAHYLLEEKERALTHTQREFDSTKVALERERHLRETAESALENARAQLAAARATVSDNEGVIAWLNKELTEVTTGGAVPAHPRGLLASGALGGGAGASIARPPTLPIATPQATRVAAMPSSASTAATPSFSASVLGATARTHAVLTPAPAATVNASLSLATHNRTSATAATGVAGVGPSSAPSSNNNPYLAGTVPLMQALTAMSATKGANASAYFPSGGPSSAAMNSSSVVPGGTPSTPAQIVA